RLGILSSNSEDNIRRCLVANGVEQHFAFVVGYPRLFGKGKALRRILRAEKLDRSAVLYVGDEGRGVEAAQRGGGPEAAGAGGVGGGGAPPGGRSRGASARTPLGGGRGQLLDRVSEMRPGGRPSFLGGGGAGPPCSTWARRAGGSNGGLTPPARQ